MWHAQIQTLVLRHYKPGMSYEEQDPYEAVAQVEFLGGGLVFIHSTLSTSGRPLSLAMWRDLARLLHDRFGVTTIQADRPGGRTEFDVRRLYSKTHS